MKVYIFFKSDFLFGVLFFINFHLVNFIILQKEDLVMMVWTETSLEEMKRVVDGMLEMKIWFFLLTW